MATVSNTCNGSLGKYCNVYLDYTINNTQEDRIARNKSNVTLNLYAQATSTSVGAFNFNHNSKADIKINDVVKISSTTLDMDFRNKKVVNMLTWTGDVDHNTDGTLKIKISGSFDTNGPSSVTTGSVEYQWELPTIPRASEVFCADGYIGVDTKINITRANDNFTHTLKYSFGNISNELIVTKTTLISYPWVIPTKLYEQIKDATEGNGTITCETFNGNISLGTNSCPFKVLVDETTNKPTITATIIDTNLDVIKITEGQGVTTSNKLVKGLSNAQVTVTATPKNGATIVESRVNGFTTTNNIRTFNSIETNIFQLDCIDSRGFTGTNTIIKVGNDWIDYIKLAITNISIYRESSTSNTVKLDLRGNYFDNKIGNTTNTLTLKWNYRETGTSKWSGDTTITATKSGNSFSYNGTLGTNFDYQKSYDFQVIAQDKLVTNIKTITVTVGIPLIDLWKDNIKINGTIHGELNGNSSSSTKVYGTLTNPTSSTTYYVPFYSTEANGNKDLRQNNGFKHISLEGTETTDGYSILHLGNGTVSKNAGNKYGRLRLYSTNKGYADLRYTNSTSSVSLFLPVINGNIQAYKNLYNNESGTTGSITLNESAANFNYIEIFYTTVYYGSIKSVKIPSPNNKIAMLDWFHVFGHESKTSVAITRYLSISGTSVTVTSGVDTYGEWWSNYNTIYDRDSIKILRIDGWK